MTNMSSINALFEEAKPVFALWNKAAKLGFLKKRPHLTCHLGKLLLSSQGKKPKTFPVVSRGILETHLKHPDTPQSAHDTMALPKTQQELAKVVQTFEQAAHPILTHLQSLTIVNTQNLTANIILHKDLHTQEPCVSIVFSTNLNVDPPRHGCPLNTPKGLQDHMTLIERLENNHDPNKPKWIVCVRENGNRTLSPSDPITAGQSLKVLGRWAADTPQEAFDWHRVFTDPHLNPKIEDNALKTWFCDTFVFPEEQKGHHLFQR